MNIKFDPLYNLETLEILKNRKEKYFNDTVKYQKLHGFDMGTGKHATWNNEADAFKHAYMQAHSRVFDGSLMSKFAANIHERNGNKYMGQSSGEENMDLWNNAVGQEIGEEVVREFNGIMDGFTKEQIEDWIAYKVMQRMKSGQLITNPNDTRKYIPNKRNNITGQAAPIDYIDKYIFSPEEIGKMSLEEFQANEEEIMRQYEAGLIIPKQETSPKIDFSGYENPLTKSNKIYTKEQISKMHQQEFDKLYEEIMAQVNSSIGIPSEKILQEELSKNGTIIYVRPYTRSDGTHVSGYYRSR